LFGGEELVEGYAMHSDPPRDINQIHLTFELVETLVHYLLVLFELTIPAAKEEQVLAYQISRKIYSDLTCA